MLYNALVILHLLGASVWVGGHIVLVRVILPSALKERDPKRILDFEHGYGKVGMMALAIQVVTGLWLASIRLEGLTNIFNTSNPASHAVLLKLVEDETAIGGEGVVPLVFK